MRSFETKRYIKALFWVFIYMLGAIALSITLAGCNTEKKWLQYNKCLGQHKDEFGVMTPDICYEIYVVPKTNQKFYNPHNELIPHKAVKLMIKGYYLNLSTNDSLYLQQYCPIPKTPLYE